MPDGCLLWSWNDLDLDLGADAAIGRMMIDRAGGDDELQILFRSQRHIATRWVDRGLDDDGGAQTEPEGKDIPASFCVKLAVSCALTSAARIRLSKWLVRVRIGWVALSTRYMSPT